MSLFIFSILVIGLPLFGWIITLIAIQRIIDPIFEGTKSNSLDREKSATFVNAKINIFRVFPFTGVIIGGMVLQLFLFSDNKLPTDIEEKILLSSGLAVGFSAFFMCIGMMLIYREAIPKVIENQSNFGRYLVLSSLPYTTLIYGLLSSMLLFLGLGLLGGDPLVTLSIEDANSIFYNYLLFSILTSFTILKGYLPTIVKEDIIPIDLDERREKDKQRSRNGNQMANSPDPTFSKKMILGIIPEFPIIIGLLFVILSLVAVGIL